MRLEGVYHYPACVDVFSLCFIAIKHSHSNCNWQFICLFSALLLADCNKLIIGGDTRATETILSHCFNWVLLLSSYCIGEVVPGSAKKGIWLHRLGKFYGLYCMISEQITFHQQLCCLNTTKMRWEKLMILEQVDFALTGWGSTKFAWWNHSRPIIIDSKSIIFWISHSLPQYKLDILNVCYFNTIVALVNSICWIKLIKWFTIKHWTVNDKYVISIIL